MHWRHAARRAWRIALRFGGAIILFACFFIGGRWSGHIDGAWANSGFDFANSATGLVLGAVMLGFLGLVVQAIAFLIRRVRGIM